MWRLRCRFWLPERVGLGAAGTCSGFAPADAFGNWPLMATSGGWLALCQPSGIDRLHGHREGLETPARFWRWLPPAWGRDATGRGRRNLRAIRVAIGSTFCPTSLAKLREIAFGWPRCACPARITCYSYRTYSVIAISEAWLGQDEGGLGGVIGICDFYSSTARARTQFIVWDLCRL